MSKDDFGQGSILTDAVHYGGAECRRGNGGYAGFDTQFNQEGVAVAPGQALWLDDHEKMLTTQVGTGIALTIFDQKLRFGVLAHVVLPPQIVEAFPHFDQVDQLLQMRSVRPIEEAVNEMKRHGAGKGRIRIRMFGGAHFSDDPYDTGTKTYVFVKSYLLEKGLQIMSEDIGGQNIMRVHFLPETGAVSRFILRRKSDFIDLQIEEESYFKS